MIYKNNFCYRIIKDVSKGIKKVFNKGSQSLTEFQKEKIEFILIALCTCKRPKMLSTALESINALKLPDSIKTEVLIIDNDIEQSAISAVENFKNKTNLVVHYSVEPQRGIANARNKLLEEAINLGATHIAMFDDDEILDEDWLLKHIELYDKYESSIISSGPTTNRFVDDFPDYITQNYVFKTKTTKETGEQRQMCASGNVFFPVSIAADKKIYFDNAYVFMGGEDGDFFNRASIAGYSIIWNNEAIAHELIGKERANLKWILNRNYYNGYSGARVRFKNNNKKYLKLLYLMDVLFVLILDIVVFLPSVLLGRVMFFNILGLIFKNAGKLSGLIKAEPINYYENICGE